jgi:GNAT superfamily N-acetyltransferase
MIQTRKAELADLQALADLFDAYRVFYQKPTDVMGAIQFLRERMERAESVIFVSVSKDGTLTGFVQLYPIFSSTRMKRMWLLNDLYVQPAHRGQGQSVALIEAAKELCRQTDACGLLLETAKDNVIGNLLYPRTGFELDEGHNYYFWEKA